MHSPREVGDHTQAKVKRAEFDEYRRRSTGRAGLLSKRDRVLLGGVAIAIVLIAVTVTMLK